MEYLRLLARPTKQARESAYLLFYLYVLHCRRDSRSNGACTIKRFLDVFLCLIQYVDFILYVSVFFPRFCIVEILLSQPTENKDST